MRMPRGVLLASLLAGPGPARSAALESSDHRLSLELPPGWVSEDSSDYDVVLRATGGSSEMEIRELADLLPDKSLIAKIHLRIRKLERNGSAEGVVHDLKLAGGGRLHYTQYSLQGRRYRLGFFNLGGRSFNILTTNLPAAEFVAVCGSIAPPREPAPPGEEETDTTVRDVTQELAKAPVEAPTDPQTSDEAIATAPGALGGSAGAPMDGRAEPRDAAPPGPPKPAFAPAAPRLGGPLEAPVDDRTEPRGGRTVVPPGSGPEGGKPAPGADAAPGAPALFSATATALAPQAAPGLSSGTASAPPGVNPFSGPGAAKGAQAQDPASSRKRRQYLHRRPALHLAAFVTSCGVAGFAFAAWRRKKKAQKLPPLPEAKP